MHASAPERPLMATQQNVTPRQLELARKALWHQDGNALHTTDSVRTWLNEAGLVPVYPHPQFATPAPSFAEAVLGRPENGWVPQPARTAASTRYDAAGVASFAVGDLDEVPEDEDDSDDEDFDEDNEDFDGEEDEEEEEDEEIEEGEPSGEDAEDDGSDDEDGVEDEDEPATAEGDVAMLAGDGNIPSDRETMLSDDDEIAEDEGDEIAEEDRIHAAAAEPAADPIDGFTAEERETVHRTMARLVEDGTAVPLNLLGSTTGEPDFLVSASAFSFVYTLRGDKNWKAEPSTTGAMRVSPLGVKVYEILKEKGALAPHEITSELGQGVTDSATLRALAELWAIQRVLPLPDADGATAKWELMTGRFVRHMKAGANAGQPTALSALLSLYLAQAVAATSDEMEIFLSPLAARSRVREVVSGLSATRQLEPLVIEGKTLLHITGALPQLPSDDTQPQAQFAQRSRYEIDDRRADMDARAARGESAGDDRRPARTGAYPVRKPAGARTEGERGGRPGFGGSRPAFGGGARPAFNRDRGDRPPFGSRPAFGGDRERRPFNREGGDRPRPAQGTDRPSFARPWDEERSARPARPEGEERRPFTPREGGDRRPFAPRGDRPFTPREGGDRRPFAPRGDRPFTPRGDGERRPFTPREGGDRKPFAPRGDRPFTPRGDGERRPFTPREGGDRRPFAPRGDRPFTPREGGDRKSFAPRGDRPFTPRTGGFGKPGARPSFRGPGSGPARGGAPRRRPE